MPTTSDRSERSSLSRAVERAVHEEQNADRLDARPAFDKTDAFHKRLEAGRAHGEAARLRDCLPETLVGDPSTEMVPALQPTDEYSPARLSMVDTLAVPDVIAVDASEQRAHRATKVGVLSAALDTAKTARAKNSIEKMLCHQIAACHDARMDLLGRFQDSDVFGKMPVVEQMRYINAAARMFDASQAPALTLQKIQSGGKQHVVVQYQQQVNVSDGGQAVVAGRIRGSRRRKDPMNLAPIAK
jgi:hypothetical protein